MLIGRRKQIELLDKVMLEETAQLVMVYGRRRVGKTHLIEHYFSHNFDFSICGQFNGDMEEELNIFKKELSFRTNREIDEIASWDKAFELLKRYIEQKRSKEKVVVFFDEMPWLNTQKSGFLQSFENFWNGYGSRVDNLVFIICGSDSSWLINKIKKNKGGLYNRKTSEILVKPFTLKETEEYLIKKGAHWSRFTIAECYMIFGGIPYYLSYLNTAKTFDENVDDLLFDNEGQLADEYETLCKTLFKNGKAYHEILDQLSKNPGGLKREDFVSDKINHNNGYLSNRLDVLEKSGFIRRFTSIRDGRKLNLYRLSDFFTIFNLKFVLDNKGRNKKFWSQNYNSPLRNAWEGLSFELLCFDHLDYIKDALRISQTNAEYNWSISPTEEKKGSQIDLVIERKDRTINLCEVKFTKNVFELDKDTYLKLAQAVDNFVSFTKTKKDIQTVFITTFGLTNSKYRNAVNRVLTLDDLFA